MKISCIQKKKKKTPPQAFCSVQYFFMKIPCPSHGYFCFSNSDIPLDSGFLCNMECRSKFTVPFFCLQRETNCLHKLYLKIVTMMVTDFLGCERSHRKVILHRQLPSLSGSWKQLFPINCWYQSIELQGIIP